MVDIDGYDMDDEDIDEEISIVVIDDDGKNR
jgi:hypothetical protein